MLHRSVYPRLCCVALLCAPLASSAYQAVARHGTLLHSVPLGMDPGAMALDPATGHLFVAGQRWRRVATTGNSSGYEERQQIVLFTIGTQSGAAVRHALVPNLRGIPATMVVASRAGHVFVAPSGGSPGQEVGMIDARSGLPLGVAHPGGPVPALPPGSSYHEQPTLLAVDNRANRLFVLGQSAYDVASATGTRYKQADSISMLDAATGRTLAVRAVGPNEHLEAVAVDESTGHAFVGIAHFGRPAAQGRIEMLDASSGDVLGSTPVGMSVNPLAMAVDTTSNRLLAVNSAQPTSLIVFDTRTGALLRTTPLGHDVSYSYNNPLAIDPATHRAFLIAHEANGNPYGSGVVSVFDTRSGAALASVRAGRGPVAIVVDTRQGRVYVASTGNPQGASGTLTVINATSGAIVRTITLPGHPSNVLVDPATQYVFISLHALVLTNNALTQDQIAASGRVIVLDPR